MHFDVSREDIDLGHPWHSFHCPVALALNRQTDQVWCLHMWGITCYTADGRVGHPYLYSDFPPEVLAFVMALDNGEPVEPFAFEWPWGQGKGTPGAGPA